MAPHKRFARFHRLEGMWRRAVGTGALCFVAALTAGAQPTLSAAVGSPIPIPASPGTTGRMVATADLDGDGREDVLLSDGRANLGWLKNRGGGQFDSPRVIGRVEQVRDVAAADLDADGDLDLVAAGEGLIHFENLGGGRFLSHGPVDPYPARSGYLPPAVRAELVDLDGDGDLDLAGGSRLGALGWAPNEGGRFGDFTALSEGRGSPTFIDFVVLDADGDGRPDLLSLHPGRRSSGSRAGGRVRWRRNLGDGAFAPPDSLVTVAANPLRLERGDLDGDGRDDLVVATASFSDHVLQWVPGGSGFEQVRTLATGVNTWDSYGRRLRVADFDGDEDDDVLVSALHETIWVENRVEGFAPPVRLVEGGSGAIAVTDLDGDGDLDLVRAGEWPVSFQSRDRVSWYEQGGGPWASPRRIATYHQTDRVSLVDADGDGVLDLLTDERLDGAGGRLALYRGAGNGLFHPPMPALSDSLRSGFAVHVLDPEPAGDSRLLLTRNAAHARYAVWTDSVYVLTPIPDTGPLTRATSGDVDGDGWPDLVAVVNGGGVVWWRNVEGVWEEGYRVIDPRSYRTDDLAVGDLDADGDLDVIVGFADQPVVWKNGGGGRAWSRHPLDVPERGRGARRVHVGAATSDDRVPTAPFVVSAIPIPCASGDPSDCRTSDTVRERYQADAFIIVNGDYRQHLGRHEEPACMLNALSDFWSDSEDVAFADLDGDGLDDIVSPLGVDGQFGMVVCYGEGPYASFAAPTPLAPFLVGARRVEVVDVDGDGDLDLVGFVGQTLYWSERMWE